MKQNTGKFIKINDPIWFVKSTQLVLNFLLGNYFAYSTQLFTLNF